VAWYAGVPDMYWMGCGQFVKRKRGGCRTNNEHEG
jgi:hypothetical protein